MCGCNKGVRGTKKGPTGPPRQVTIQNTTTPRNRPAQVQAQAETQPASLNKNQREVERKRREAILRKLGRL